MEKVNLPVLVEAVITNFALDWAIISTLADRVGVQRTTITQRKSFFGHHKMAPNSKHTI